MPASCYFYNPPSISNASESTTFYPLLNGNEHPKLVQTRQSMFQKTHRSILKICHDCIQEKKKSLYLQVQDTLSNISSQMHNNPVIPTVIISSDMEIDENERMCHELKGFLLNSSTDNQNIKCIIIDTKYTRTLRSQVSAIIDQYMDTWCDSVDFDMIANNVSKNQRLVILFHYLEDMEPGLMDQFIFMLHEYLPKIKMEFVIWMTTPPWRLHEYMSSRSLTTLSLDIIPVPEREQLLDDIIDQIFIKQHHSIRLGGQVLDWMLKQFKLIHRSYRTFITQLEYCIFEYYFHNPLSVLMPSFGKNLDQDIISLLNNLDPFHFERLGMMKSFQKMVESHLSNNQEYAMRLLSDNQIFYSYLPGIIKEFMIYLDNFSVAFQCLYELQLHLSLSKQKTKLYLYRDCHIHDQPISNSEYFYSLLGLYKTLDKDELYQLLCNTRDIIYSSISDNHHSNLSCQDILDKLVHLLNQYERDILNIENHNVISKKKISIADFVKEIRSLFKNYFETNLKCYSEIECHELFYFDAIIAVKKAYNPNPKMQIQDTFMNPQHYLKCTCDGQMSPSLPDICILYKLYLEFGRWINLNDWMGATMNVLGIDPDSDRFENEKESLRERFFQGISELCHLGFIKLSSKKREYALRLIFDTRSS